MHYFVILISILRLRALFMWNAHGVQWLYYASKSSRIPMRSRSGSCSFITQYTVIKKNNNILGINYNQTVFTRIISATHAISRHLKFTQLIAQISCTNNVVLALMPQQISKTTSCTYILSIYSDIEVYNMLHIYIIYT